jgi:serine/threonine-protein kinase
MKDAGVEQWKQANEVYTKLLDLTVGEAISELHGMQDLSDEVKSLVMALVSSGSQSSQFFSQQISASFQPPAWQQSMCAIGDELGEYIITGELGHGGMASVYQAQRKGTEKQKPVAIKVFNRTQLTPILLNRFAVEQDVLAGLSHPHIVNMHHGGSSQSGAPYIVMDLIEQAQDIDDYCLSNAVGQREVIEFILAAAHAIAHAHQNLIVHRDIKPSNLLIDGNQQLKVVDFGIAKLMGQQDAPQKTTILALTPSFAAPEQINSGQISVTTDVFSLAAVLLSLIIKALPLPEDRLLKSCANDQAHIEQLLKSKIKDKDLRHILNQALQQDPHKRYRNMDLFAQDLTAWLARKPVQATPDSWFYRISKFAQRRSALFAALSTLLVMIVLGIVLLGWQVDKTQTEARKANEVKDFMLGVFSVVDPDEAVGEKILAKDLLSQAFAEIQAKDFQDSHSKAELLVAMGQAQLQLGLNQSAHQSFSAALKIMPDNILAQLGELKILVGDDDFPAAINKTNQLEGLLTTDDSLKADWLLLKAKLAIDHSKDYDLARNQTTQAQEIFFAEQNFKGYLTAARQLANIMYIQSQPEAAASYLEQQLKVALQQFAPTQTVVMAIKNDLVELYNDVGDYPQAIRHSTQLIDDVKTVLGEKHPFLIQAYLSQAGTQRATGELAAAKLSANQALSLSKELNGEKHESTARAINFIAVLHYVDGEIELALDNMQLAAHLFEQILGDDHPETWDVKTNLTALLNMSGRYDEAIATVEPVYQKQLAVLGAGHKSTVYSQTILARLYGDVGRLSEAQVLGEDMLYQAVNELGMEHPLTVGGHFTLAKIYQHQGKFDAAIKLIKTVINSESWDDSNERAIGAYNTLADLYLDEGRLASATEFKEKSLAVAINLLAEDSPRVWDQMLNNLNFYIELEDLQNAAVYISRLNAIFNRNTTVSEKHAARFERLKVEAEGLK